MPNSIVEETRQFKVFKIGFTYNLDKTSLEQEWLNVIINVKKAQPIRLGHNLTLS